MRAHILSIGSELMLGHLTDTNATFLAQELSALGVELINVTQVGDDRARISDAIRSAIRGADVVVCTGGIGPIEDDLTREAIADVVAERPVVDAKLVAEIEAFFAARGLAMPERNAKQAWTIDSAEPLENPVGTAPGWYVTVNDARVIAMPGVPREMRRMWREQAVPRLQPLLGNRVVQSVTLKTIGIGESAAEDLIHDLVVLENPVVATYAKDDGVHVRLTASGETEREARSLLRPVEADVRQRLADYIYADGDRSLAAALINRLESRSWSLSVVDEGSGGRFTSLLLSDMRAAERNILGSVRPVVLAGRRGDATQLATSASNSRQNHIGMAIVVAVERSHTSIVDARINLAIRGACVADQSFSTRATFDEVQRRSALHAADVLLRALGRL